MQRQALRHLVDLLALAMQREPREIERFGRNSRDRGAIVGVVARREKALRVKRRPQTALERTLEHFRKLIGRGRKHEDRLPDERAIDLPGCVDIGLPGKPGIGSDQPARQETGDIEFLPGGEIISNHDGDLGIEAHEHESGPAPETPS